MEMQHKENRVSCKQAAKELQIDLLTLYQLMQRGMIDIGYVIKKDGKEKYSYYIYRALLDKEKERLGIQK